jgi:branched-chain amino acid transport system permease protein
LKVVAQILVNGLIAGATYALMALGVSLIYGTVRFFHFAHGGVFLFAGYLAWTVADNGVSLWLGGPMAVVAAGGFGWAIERFVYRPLRVAGAPKLVLLLASFGVFVVTHNALQLIFGTRILLLLDGAPVAGYRVLGANITDVQVAIIAAGIVLPLLLFVILRRTALGRSIRAVSDDAVVAELCGIDTGKTIGGAFFLGSMLSGAAGVLVSLESGLHPMLGLNAAVKGIIAALVGGIGSIPGAVVGGLLIGGAENLGVWGVSSGWKDAFAFAVLVAFLLLRPSGVIGTDSFGRRL